jgi:hypothetical protein
MRKFHIYEEYCNRYQQQLDRHPPLLSARVRLRESCK